jgi:hypothetical protein
MRSYSIGLLEARIDVGVHKTNPAIRHSRSVRVLLSGHTKGSKFLDAEKAAAKVGAIPAAIPWGEKQSAALAKQADSRCKVSCEVVWLFARG